MDLYFDELNRETQDFLLSEYGILDPKEMNWDVTPIGMIFCFENVANRREELTGEEM